MNLVIDIGNTLVKASIFKENTLVEQCSGENVDWENLIATRNITHSLLCNVAGENTVLEKLLESKTHFTKLQATTLVPFTNLYKSPQTLGMDRVALVAGALHFYPNQNCLIADTGTCVTFDFVNRQHEYLGGSISPGLQMRLDAMHYFTKRLPKLVAEDVDDFNGISTETCMQSGAFFGLLEEIKGRIKLYNKRYGPTLALLCGGNAPVIHKALLADEGFDNEGKKCIFAHPSLLLYGLNKILLFNAKNSL